MPSRSSSASASRCGDEGSRASRASFSRSDMFGLRSACGALAGESSPEDILATRSHSAPIPSSELWSLPADMDSKPPRRDSRRTPRQDRRFPVFTCRDPDRVHIRLASPDESCGFLSWAIMGSAVTTPGAAPTAGAIAMPPPPLRILLSNAATGATMSDADEGTLGQRPLLSNLRARRQERQRWPPDEPPSRALPHIESEDRATRTWQKAQLVQRQCVQSICSAVH